MPEKSKIIIIGAGGAGLFTAYLLSQRGYEVTILEARDRIGGRMNTVEGMGFTKPVDLGAEFIHGEANETFDLCKNADIEYYEISGELWRYDNRQLSPADEFVEHADVLEKNLQELDREMSLQDFLSKCLPPDSKLKKSLKEYIEGYDLADIKRASTLAFKEEWLKEENEKQYRLKGGYKQLTNYLGVQCRKNGVKIILSSPVQSVNWEKDNVEIISGVNKFVSDKLVITVPIGILLLPHSDKESIQFKPEVFDPELINQFGYGSVMKVLMEFDTPFWKNDQTLKQSIPELSFLFSNETIPTWWTHYPEENAIITGWLAQPGKTDQRINTREDCIAASLAALGKIFNCSEDYLSQKLIAFAWCDWLEEPYSRGAYSYMTVTTKHARKELSKDKDNTLFFAGEALAIDGETGTVEAAFKSARSVVNQIAGK